MSVRMVDFYKFAIRLLDFPRRGLMLDTEGGVMIGFVHDSGQLILDVFLQS